MKHILVPVDFCNTSATALRFGTYLAEVMNLNLRVVHVLDANFSSAQAFSIGAWRAEKDRLRKKLERFTLQHAQPILATFQHAPETLPVLETAVYEGFPVKVVCALSEMKNTELVIMGGMGAGKKDQPTGLFGGVARGMGLYSRSPVIMLPPNYGYPAVGSLAIAFGRLKDIKQLEGITKRIISVLQPKVSFLHVDESGKEEGEAFTKEFVKLALSAGFSTGSFSYSTLAPGPVARRLLDYVRTEKTGLLVLGHRKRGAWENIFFKGRTKPLIDRCEVPLLVVPAAPVE